MIHLHSHGYFDFSVFGHQKLALQRVPSLPAGLPALTQRHGIYTFPHFSPFYYEFKLAQLGKFKRMVKVGEIETGRFFSKIIF